MKWKKYTLTTTTQAVDLISAELDGIGIEGIEIEDNIPLTAKDTKGMFVDVLPFPPPDDGIARLSFYLDPDSDTKGTIEKAGKALKDLSRFTDLGPCTIAESETEDKDWVNNWKTFFHPFTVDDILIKPTWEKVPDSAAGKTVIEIDPGTAFGTGSHETTQLCIRQIEKYIKIMKEAGAGEHIEVLDVGTGSGILGIAALKFGACHVFATDLDDNAVNAVGENLKSNGISGNTGEAGKEDGKEQFRMICGDIISNADIQRQAGDGVYDIAVANILAPVIVELQKEVYRHLKHGGIFITSGIIDTAEEKVRKAIGENPEWEFLETNHQGEWVNITVRRK